MATRTKYKTRTQKLEARRKRQGSKQNKSKTKFGKMLWRGRRMNTEKKLGIR